MNQQRSRRFRASKEWNQKYDKVSRIKEELNKRGVTLPPTAKNDSFDANSITPGTMFMMMLAEAIEHYIMTKMNCVPAWKNIAVIFSDSNSPGEGEHKIINFIKEQKCNETIHCLYGADADLIILGLSTHHRNFTVVREAYNSHKIKLCEVCQKLGHTSEECIGINEDKEVEMKKPDVKFVFVRLQVLREHISKELYMENMPFPFDFERGLDDYVFLTFLIGNDFLPHIPSLEIREGALDSLVKFYKRAVVKSRAYLTENGNINLNMLHLIMIDLADCEGHIFKKRRDNELKEREKKIRQQKKSESEVLHPNEPTSLKRKRSNEDELVSDTEPEDNVRLWEDGWQYRYYEQKFKVDKSNLQFRRQVAEEYVRGLCWVLRYYYEKCPSYSWFYPFHYPPMGCDFKFIKNLNIDFVKGQPLKPLEQLMAVLPTASKHLVPKPWGELMSNPDSNIMDFYPTNFQIDLNGRKFLWQGVALLPFIDELRLKKALEPVYPRLTADERRRNAVGSDKLFINNIHLGYKSLLNLHEKETSPQLEHDLNPTFFNGITGCIVLSEEEIFPKQAVTSPLQSLSDLSANTVICVKYCNRKNCDLVPAETLESAIDLKVLHKQVPDEKC